MAETLQLPIPDVLIARYVVVDPRTVSVPVDPVDPVDVGVGVEEISAADPALPDPGLLAGGGAEPAALARVYESGRHLLVTATAHAVATARTGEVRDAHLGTALAAGAALAERTGGLLLDPVTARFVTGDQEARKGDRGRWLRIAATGDASGLRMVTMGLSRFGLPELCTRALAPYLGPAWARLTWSLAWRLADLRPAPWPSPAAGGTWSLADEIEPTVAGMGRDTDTDTDLDAAALRVRLRRDAEHPGTPLLLLPPDGFTGTEPEWRREIVNRLLPAARI